jgi:hypothetical protein
MRVTLLGIFDENIKHCKWNYKDLKTFDYKCISITVEKTAALSFRSNLEKTALRSMVFGGT